MKTKSYLYIFILVILLGGVIYFSLNKKTGTVSNSMKNFAVKDTASISKIFLADRSGESATLTRGKNGKWIINNKFNAFQDRVKLLLECINRLEIRNPVPLNSRNNVFKDMSTSAVKINIFQGENLVKTYYVGGTSQDYLGTYMMLEGSEEPFETYIPGFEGYLNIRYFTSEKEWRNREIYRLDASKIASVKISFPTSEGNNFEISRVGEDFEISNTQTKRKISLVAGKELFSGVSYLDFDEFAKKADLKIKDSILSSVPIFSIEIKLQDGKEIPQLKLFQKGAESSTKKVINGNIDGDLFYGTLSSNPEELFIAQRFVLKKVLNPPSYYLNK